LARLGGPLSGNSDEKKNILRRGRGDRELLKGGRRGDKGGKEGGQEEDRGDRRGGRCKKKGEGWKGQVRG